MPQMMQLAKCEKCEVRSYDFKDNHEFIPIVFSDGQIYVKLEGQDVTKIKNKLKSKVLQLSDQMLKLEGEMRKANYKDLVPDDVQKSNDEKLLTLKEQFDYLSLALERLSVD
ncbi:hypothetical protein ACOME3_000944 [Neoechinorhynchus agilis]